MWRVHECERASVQGKEELFFISIFAYVTVCWRFQTACIDICEICVGFHLLDDGIWIVGWHCVWYVYGEVCTTVESLV